MSGPQMPTYLDWDREVLEQCYDLVDGISLHRYYGNALTGETGGDTFALPRNEPGNGAADRRDQSGCRCGARAEALQQDLIPFLR